VRRLEIRNQKSKCEQRESFFLDDKADLYPPAPFPIEWGKGRQARRFFWLLGFLTFWLLGAGAFAAQKDMTPMPQMDCSECHTCKRPTKDNPCLAQCPRPHATSKDVGHVPETVLLYELEKDYEPVAFNHRVHAQMSSMSKEACADCHHFSEGGKIEACKTCHPVSGPDEMRQPSLKGAYHRQCMKCHEQWSGETSCEMCHLKKTLPGPLTMADTGHVTPNASHMPKALTEMSQPKTKVWNSTYGGGTVVTLHHRNHTEKYGIDCSACHHAEGCGACHSKEGTTAQVSKSESALHATCNACHAEMSCAQCHQKSVAPEFSHDRTGFSLGKHHSGLQCKACHGEPTHFTKPNPECSSCHSNFAEGKFNHSLTGVALDENHKEIGCDVCHVNRAFGQKPKCTECHGEEFAYPAKVPGSRVKSGRG
jgi:hypothetical protein